MTVFSPSRGYMALADTTLVPRLRRMVNEPTSATYSDALLEAYITTYPLPDSAGLETGDDGWVPTYDLAAAAQDIWTEKASAVAAQHDFSADSSSFTVSQIYQQYMSQARFYGARRKAVSKKQIKAPTEPVQDRFVSPSDTNISGPFAWEQTELYTGDILPEDLP